MVQLGWCAAADAAAHTFVPELPEHLTIAGREGHHLQRVRRLRSGERVTAADGTGTWRPYEITGAVRGRLELTAAGPACAEPEPAPAVTLALALTKVGLDQVVAPVTELGVARVEPVRTRRSVVRWDAAKAAAAVARMQAIARAAAAQSRRARIPLVAPVAPLEHLTGRPGLVVADRAGVPAAALRVPDEQGWTVLVGPEGGLDAEELAALGDGFERLAVGPHVLRAGTAPVAAVAALRGRSTGANV
jgi:16S rRNA (uracil1498-N3)-methyltransferase